MTPPAVSTRTPFRVRRAHPVTPVRVALVALLGLLAATLVTAGPASAATNGSMVSLGDSVPAGARCGCTAFPLQYAAEVARHTGRAVRMTNDAVSGATSTTVLRQLGTTSVRSAVRASGTALVMVGANDFAGAFTRVLRHEQRADAAFPPVATRVRTNVTRIIRILRQLHPGIRVLVANYWNVVKDGRVGRLAYGAWGVQKAAQATTYADRALGWAAHDAGAILVSTYVPFKGVHGTIDPTSLLASDGDHPNARGHAVIARAFYRFAVSG